jgi:hypothetical protein
MASSKKQPQLKQKVVNLQAAKPKEDDCKHAEAAKRYAEELMGDIGMTCGDCDEDIIIHTMNFVALKEEQLEELKIQMEALAEYQAKINKRKALGLVLPGDEEPQA